MPVKFVDLTTEERKEMKDVRKRAEFEKNFWIEIAEFEQDCLREKVPFCHKCAVNEFERQKKAQQDKLNALFQSGRRNEITQIKEDELRIKVDFSEFTKDYLKLVKKHKESDRQKFHTKIYEFHDYKCPYGHQNTIQIDEGKSLV